MAFFENLKMHTIRKWIRVNWGLDFTIIHMAFIITPRSRLVDACGLVACVCRGMLVASLCLLENLKF